MRLAAIDVGTNTALLLVAEVSSDGVLRVLHDEEEITRLGRGVDRTGELALDRIDFVAGTLARYAQVARAHGATQVVACATSAARDANNRDILVEAIRERSGVVLEVISGDEEAALCFRAVHHAYGATHSGRPLIALDIGGGSTELVVGTDGCLTHRRSYQVGSVRLTERFATQQPIAETDWNHARAHLSKTFADVLPAPEGSLLIGVAATVTNLAGLHLQRPLHETEGARLRREDIARVAKRVADLSREQREQLSERSRGLGFRFDVRRADVLPMGGLILEEAMRALCVQECVVTDRGLRYGLLLRAAGR